MLMTTTSAAALAAGSAVENLSPEDRPAALFLLTLMAGAAPPVRTAIWAEPVAPLETIAAQISGRFHVIWVMPGDMGSLTMGGEPHGPERGAARSRRRRSGRNPMSVDRHARTMLPIPDRPAPGLTTYDAKDPDTAFPPIEPLLPPRGRRTCWSILVDDVGFGAASAFGGPCNTPTAERLAAGGLRYNRFHTTALCAPTRAALLSGRNHHSVGMGIITETATSAPGNSSLRPNTKAPLAMTLKLNGYSTAQFGKCHEVPVWQSSPMGPFDAWPSGGGGFETFYGFIGGENNQWDPALYDGTTPVEPPATAEEGYHLTEDLADRAISWVRQQKALMPDKPFFVYFAPGATHAPHHVPKEWADKYAGPVRRRLGRAARAHVRPAEGARGDPRRRRADRPPRRDPGVGRHARRAQAGARPARWRCTPGSWSTPTTTSAG